jgi:hypothetical protein
MLPGKLAMLLKQLLVFSRGIGVKGRGIAARGGYAGSGACFVAVGAFESCQLRRKGVTSFLVLGIVSLKAGNA